MSDALGDRMKEQYEDRTRYMLPRRTYTIIRLDSVSFHRFTRNLVRPYDFQFAKVIDAAALALLQFVQGADLAYTQSDEISLLVSDFTKPTTQAWFNGNLQKIVSVSAGIASTTFNLFKDTIDNLGHENSAVFDARAFTIADPVEVENYFIWRQKDCAKNSVQQVARFHYSHNDLKGVGIPALHELIHDKGDNWAKYPDRFKRGGFLTAFAGHNDAAPIFTSESGRDELRSFIPTIWSEDKEEGNG